MIPFKINGKRYQLPTCWEDMTVSQFQELKRMNEADEYEYIRFLSIVTGVPFETLFHTKSLDVMDKIEPFLAFIKTPLEKTKAPKAITINGKECPVPTDLRDYTYGQKVHAWNAIAKAIEEHKDPYADMAYIVAIYLQPLATGKNYSEAEAKKMAKEVIGELSLVPTYHIAAFFLNQYAISRNANQLPYPLNRIKNRWLLAYVNSIYSKKLTRSMRLQGEIS